MMRARDRNRGSGRTHKSIEAALKAALRGEKVLYMVATRPAHRDCFYMAERMLRGVPGVQACPRLWEFRFRRGGTLRFDVVRCGSAREQIQGLRGLHVDHSLWEMPELTEADRQALCTAADVDH